MEYSYLTFLLKTTWQTQSLPFLDLSSLDPFFLGSEILLAPAISSFSFSSCKTNERTNQRTNVIGFGLILTSLRFCPERVVVGEETGNTWIHFGCGARVTGWRTGRQACHPPLLVSFSLILITLGPSVLSLKSAMVTINKKNGALLARQKKNCCAIRWPKCPRLRKVQNENKGCSRKRKINWIYHDNKQSFLFFFSLVHNILLIFCFIQLHKRLENITKQTVKQQQKAKLSLFLLITVFFYGYWL